MPRRRPGRGKSKNTNLNMERILMLVEGIDAFYPYKDCGPFETCEEMEETWNDHRDYILNLFIQGSDDSVIGGTGPGYRPAGWWYCESPIKDYFEAEHSGVVGDQVYLDGKYFDDLKEYAVITEYTKEDPHQFKLNQYKYLKENDFLYKWELKEIKRNGIKPDWVEEQFKEMKK